MDGLLGAVGDRSETYCTSCYTAKYPVAFPRNAETYLQLALKPVDFVDRTIEAGPHEIPTTVMG
jgi:hypothetical protein